MLKKKVSFHFNDDSMSPRSLKKQRYLQLYNADGDAIFIELQSGRAYWLLPKGASLQQVRFMTHEAEDGHPYFENLVTAEVAWQLPNDSLIMSEDARNTAISLQLMDRKDSEDHIGMNFPEEGSAQQMSELDEFLLNDPSFESDDDGEEVETDENNSPQKVMNSTDEDVTERMSYSDSHRLSNSASAEVRKDQKDALVESAADGKGGVEEEDLDEEEVERRKSFASTKKTLEQVQAWRVKTGYLMKLAKKSNRNWKKRFCVLTPFNIAYYENDKPKQSPKGEMQITNYTHIAEGVHDRKYGFLFVVTNEWESITLAASSDIDRQHWMKALRSTLDHVTGSVRSYATLMFPFLQGYNVKKTRKGELPLVQKYFILTKNLLTFHPDWDNTSVIEGVININRNTKDMIDENDYLISLVDPEATGDELSKVCLQFNACPAHQRKEAARFPVKGTDNDGQLEEIFEQWKRALLKMMGRADVMSAVSLPEDVENDSEEDGMRVSAAARALANAASDTAAEKSIETKPPPVTAPPNFANVPIFGLADAHDDDEEEEDHVPSDEPKFITVVPNQVESTSSAKDFSSDLRDKSSPLTTLGFGAIDENHVESENGVGEDSFTKGNTGGSGSSTLERAKERRLNKSTRMSGREGKSSVDAAIEVVPETLNDKVPPPPPPPPSTPSMQSSHSPGKPSAPPPPPNSEARNSAQFRYSAVLKDYNSYNRSSLESLSKFLKKEDESGGADTVDDGLKLDDDNASSEGTTASSGSSAVSNTTGKSSTKLSGSIASKTSQRKKFMAAAIAKRRSAKSPAPDQVQPANEGDEGDGNRGIKPNNDFFPIGQQRSRMNKHGIFAASGVEPSQSGDEYSNASDTLGKTSNSAEDASYDSDGVASSLSLPSYGADIDDGLSIASTSTTPIKSESGKNALEAAKLRKLRKSMAVPSNDALKCQSMDSTGSEGWHPDSSSGATDPAAGNEVDKAPGLVGALELYKENKSKPLVRMIFDNYCIEDAKIVNIDILQHLCYDFGVYFSQMEIKISLKGYSNKKGNLSYDDFMVWWRSNDKFSMLKLNDSRTSRKIAAAGLFKAYDRSLDGQVKEVYFNFIFRDLIEFNHIPKKEIYEATISKLDPNREGIIEFNAYITWLDSVDLPPQPKQSTLSKLFGGFSSPSRGSNSSSKRRTSPTPLVSPGLNEGQGGSSKSGTSIAKRGIHASLSSQQSNSTSNYNVAPSEDNTRTIMKPSLASSSFDLEDSNDFDRNSDSKYSNENEQLQPTRIEKSADAASKEVQPIVSNDLPNRDVEISIPSPVASAPKYNGKSMNALQRAAARKKDRQSIMRVPSVDREVLRTSITGDCEPEKELTPTSAAAVCAASGAAQIASDSSDALEKKNLYTGRSDSVSGRAPSISALYGDAAGDDEGSGNVASVQFSTQSRSVLRKTMQKLKEETPTQRERKTFNSDSPIGSPLNSPEQKKTMKTPMGGMANPLANRRRTLSGKKIDSSKDETPSSSVQQPEQKQNTIVNTESASAVASHDILESVGVFGIGATDSDDDDKSQQQIDDTSQQFNALETPSSKAEKLDECSPNIMQANDEAATPVTTTPSTISRSTYGDTPLSSPPFNEGASPYTPTVSLAESKAAHSPHRSRVLAAYRMAGRNRMNNQQRADANKHDKSDNTKIDDAHRENGTTSAASLPLNTATSSQLQGSNRRGSIDFFNPLSKKSVPESISAPVTTTALPTSRNPSTLARTVPSAQSFNTHAHEASSSHAIAMDHNAPPPPPPPPSSALNSSTHRKDNPPIVVELRPPSVDNDVGKGLSRSASSANDNLDFTPSKSKPLSRFNPNKIQEKLAEPSPFNSADYDLMKIETSGTGTEMKSSTAPVSKEHQFEISKTDNTLPSNDEFLQSTKNSLSETQDRIKRVTLGIPENPSVNAVLPPPPPAIRSAFKGGDQTTSDPEPNKMSTTYAMNKINAFEELMRQRESVDQAMHELHLMENAAMDRINAREAGAKLKIKEETEKSLEVIAKAEQELDAKVAAHRKSATNEANFLVQARKQLQFEENRIQNEKTKNIQEVKKYAEALVQQQQKMAVEKKKIRQQRFQSDLNMQSTNQLNAQLSRELHELKELKKQVIDNFEAAYEERRRKDDEELRQIMEQNRKEDERLMQEELQMQQLLELHNRERYEVDAEQEHIQKQREAEELRSLHRLQRQVQRDPHSLREAFRQHRGAIGEYPYIEPHMSVDSFQQATTRPAERLHYNTPHHSETPYRSDDDGSVAIVDPISKYGPGSEELKSDSLRHLPKEQLYMQVGGATNGIGHLKSPRYVGEADEDSIVSGHNPVSIGTHSSGLYSSGRRTPGQPRQTKSGPAYSTKAPKRSEGWDGKAPIIRPRHATPTNIPSEGTTNRISQNPQRTSQVRGVTSAMYDSRAQQHTAAMVSPLANRIRPQQLLRK